MHPPTQGFFWSPVIMQVEPPISQSVVSLSLAVRPCRSMTLLPADMSSMQMIRKHISEFLVYLQEPYQFARMSSVNITHYFPVCNLCQMNTSSEETFKGKMAQPLYVHMTVVI